MEVSSRETVVVEICDGVAEVTLSRPKALNAINRQMLEELCAVLGELQETARVRAVILTGAGDKAFVAGADIAEMAEMSVLSARAFSRLGHRVLAMIEDLPVPVLAAVGGYALGGGCELALACDIIYASDRAKFGQPEVKLGLIPGFGGLVRLPRKVGQAVASEWILSGEVYGAEVAKEVGLVREVLKPDELLPRVRQVASLMAQRGPMAVRAAKRVLVRGLATDAATAAAMEQESFARLFDTEDMREGTRAFLDKRDPQFKGA